VSFFVVLSPEIEVEVGNWAKHKNTLNDTSLLLYLQADDKKKIGHELIYVFSFAAVTVK
jgi:hypothetical protein